MAARLFSSSVPIFLDKRIHLVYISAVKRTTIFLLEEQVSKLAKVAVRKGLNVAQLIRLYISEGLRKEKP